MQNFSSFTSVLLLVLALWAIPWKIYGIWTAVKNGHKKWFVALILLNTFAILEIIYIFYIAKKSWSDIKEDIKYQYHQIKGKKKE